MATLLWIVAAVLVIGGVLALFRGQMLWGIVLIVVGLLVGPGVIWGLAVSGLYRCLSSCW
jgi:hypothetical protein